MSSQELDSSRAGSASSGEGGKPTEWCSTGASAKSRAHYQAVLAAGEERAGSLARLSTHPSRPLITSSHWDSIEGACIQSCMRTEVPWQQESGPYLSTVGRTLSLRFKLRARLSMNSIIQGSEAIQKTGFSFTYLACVSLRSLAEL